MTWIRMGWVGGYLGERGETVGGAAGVADDFVFRFICLEVDATDKHGCIGRRSRDDNFLCSPFKMGGSFVNGGEHTRRLDDVLLSTSASKRYISTTFSPGDIGRVPFTVDINMMAIDNQLATLSVNITLESSMCGIIFEHVDPIIISTTILKRG
jgi:hypothetical protein